MQIHELQAGAFKNKKRVGRGGKRGTYSGRGQKGQKSRAGHVMLPAERQNVLRMPKLRGHNNKPKSEKAFAVNIADIAKIQDTVITLEVLHQQGIVRKSITLVKILSKGSIDSKKEIHNIPVSAAAAEKIIAAGGSIIK